MKEPIIPELSPDAELVFTVLTTGRFPRPRSERYEVARLKQSINSGEIKKSTLLAYTGKGTPYQKRVAKKALGGYIK